MSDVDLTHKLQTASFRRQTRQAARRPNQLVPENTVAGNALTVVIAIMSFLACLTLGAVTLVREAASDWQLDIQREVTIQVKPVDGTDLATEAARAASIARLTPGVAGVEVLDAKEDAKLLEPWLGQGFDLGDLPIPRLIAVRLSDPHAVNLGDLDNRLKAQVKGALLDDHRAWAARLQSMANATVIGGVTILGLVFVATVLSIVFATRGTMASNAVVVSVLHICGAEDGFIAREFQRHFLLLGLRGGLIGALAAGAVFAILGFAVMPSLSAGDEEQVAALFGHFAVGPIAYFGAFGIAFLVAIMTALTSRLTVYQHLAAGD
jgi:cell division transport system permease protein